MIGLLSDLVLAATKAKTTSTNPEVYIVLIAIVALGYFLLVRPQQRKAKAQRAQQQQIGVGDTVVTIGGIKGRVVAMDDQHVTIVTGEDVGEFAAKGSQPHRITLVRQAVNRRVDPVSAQPDDEDEDEEYDGDEEDDAAYDHDGYDHDGDDQVAGGGGAGS